MWTRFFGRIRARVGNEQRFISKDPSPSRAITFRWGKPSAMPRAMEEQSPKVRTRKLPSPGRRAFHSKVTAPAEVTTRASPVATAMVLKQSNLFICASHFKLAHRRWVLERLKRSSTAEEFFRQQQRHRTPGILSQNLCSLDQFGSVSRFAHNIIPNAQSPEHGLRHAARGTERSIADVTRVVNKKQQRDLVLQ